MMNLKNILNEIEHADPREFEQPKGRRQLLKSFGSKVVTSALPLAISSLFNKAQAKTTLDVHVQTLNFILELEYFAYNYYHTANKVGIGGPAPLIPVADQPGFLVIENQKKAHINFLNSEIANTYGGVPYTPKNYDPTSANPLYVVSGAYDFTAAGKYLVFSDYPTFVMISEIFEDTFVHGYLGQITNALDNAGMLSLLMRMQCDVARHASYARLVRRNLGYSVAPEHTPPWITNNIPPSAEFQLYYSHEEFTGEYGIDVANLPGYAGGATPQISASAAFDDDTKDRLGILSLLTQFRL